MKSLEELMAIKAKMKDKVALRQASDDTRIVVGMATCGIAAGARDVLNAISEELSKRNVQHAAVSQTGCIGMCQYEPIVEVMVPGEEKVTYIKVDREKAVKIVNEHIINNKPIAEYTIGAVIK